MSDPLARSRQLEATLLDVGGAALRDLISDVQHGGLANGRQVRRIAGVLGEDMGMGSGAWMLEITLTPHIWR